MLALTFQIGQDRVALDIRGVHEVVPRVRLHRPATGPAWLAGLFVYRGSPVPVIDLHRLVGAGDCPLHLSSRIILVPRPGSTTGQLLGLLAAQVADLRDVNQESGAGLSLTGKGQPGLGRVVVDRGEVLHLFDITRLLPETSLRQLEALPQEVVQ